MRIRKKFKKSHSAQRAIQWFHDNPGAKVASVAKRFGLCLLYTSPSPRDLSTSRMPSSA